MPGSMKGRERPLFEGGASKIKKMCYAYNGCRGAGAKGCERRDACRNGRALCMSSAVNPAENPAFFKGLIHVGLNP
jgi:hypothetical protein